MVFLAIFVTIIFLPIYISVYLYYDNKGKRLYFAIYLFNFVKILDGYVNRRKNGGVYVHVTETKAYVIDSELIKQLEGGSINVFPTLTLKNLTITLDIGNKNGQIVSILFVIFSLIIKCGRVIEHELPYLNLVTNLNIHDVNENFLALKSKTVICFNLFCILIKIFANLIKRGKQSAKKFAKTWKRN